MLADRARAPYTDEMMHCKKMDFPVRMPAATAGTSTGAVAGRHESCSASGDGSRFTRWFFYGPDHRRTGSAARVQI
jgi:hypothetical protein